MSCDRFSPNCKSLTEAQQIQQSCYGTTDEKGKPEYIEKGFLVSMVSDGGFSCAAHVHVGGACPQQAYTAWSSKAMGAIRAPLVHAAVDAHPQLGPSRRAACKRVLA